LGDCNCKAIAAKFFYGELTSGYRSGGGQKNRYRPIEIHHLHSIFETVLYSCPSLCLLVAQSGVPLPYAVSFNPTLYPSDFEITSQEINVKIKNDWTK